MGVRSEFSEGFFYENFGLVSGSASALAFPNAPAKLARFVAYSANANYFFFGRGANVTFELAAGVDTGWFPVVGENLNQMSYKNASGTMDKLAYWIQG